MFIYMEMTLNFVPSLLKETLKKLLLLLRKWIKFWLSKVSTKTNKNSSFLLKDGKEIFLNNPYNYKIAKIRNHLKNLHFLIGLKDTWKEKKNQKQNLMNTKLRTKFEKKVSQKVVAVQEAQVQAPALKNQAAQVAQDRVSKKEK